MLEISLGIDFIPSIIMNEIEYVNLDFDAEKYKGQEINLLDLIEYVF